MNIIIWLARGGLCPLGPPLKTATVSDLLKTNMSDRLQHVTVSIETNGIAQQYSL